MSAPADTAPAALTRTGWTAAPTVRRERTIPATGPRCAVAGMGSDELLPGRMALALAVDGLEVAVQAPLAAVERDLVAWAPDVLILACDMAHAETVVALRRLHKLHPATHIVVVSPSAFGVGGRRALNAGADGFVLDARVDTMLAPTVRAVHAGLVCAARELRRLVAKPSFSHREKEILALIATGATNHEIAARLFVTESTVKSHLASAFEKLGVRSRKDAASLLLDPEEGLQQTALPPAAPPAPFATNPGGIR